uniref:CSON003899 protein n=1 Tax=Culicoides sonorensis TaxID=179676 RepID=A0A336LT07_CULSO
MNRLIQINHALNLIDNVDDERFEVLKNFIEHKNYDPNSKNQKGFSVVHYLCGIKNVWFAERVLYYLLQHGANVNEPTTFELFTPLHIAAMNDRVSIAKILIKHGADKTCLDADMNPPIYYAISNGCMPMIELVRNYILYEKRKSEKQNAKDLLQSAHLNNLSSNASSPNVFEKNLSVGGANKAYLEADRSITPSRINYNFDKSSPYYVNITHRRRNNSSTVRQSLFPVESKKMELNVFELTEDNLAEFTKNVRESGCFDKLRQWNEKIRDHMNRHSIITTVVDEINGFVGDTLQHVEGLMTEDETFLTAKSDEESTINNQLNVPVRESDFINSPTKSEIVMQKTEHYVHQDPEKHMIFYEKKRLPVDSVFQETKNDQESDKNSTTSAGSTIFKLNTDYDTDLLRKELTQFGDVPGPITKSTKKLYLQRLVRYQRDPKIAEQLAENRANNQPVYSLELEKTFKSIDQGQSIFAEFLNLEEQMVRHFIQKPNKKNTREGNKKMSFIYLLMDPRELNNLAANHLFISKEQAWRQFIKAIFYVGKGKKSRPYAHLYEAIRIFLKSNNSNKENFQEFNRHAQPLEDFPRNKTNHLKGKPMTVNPISETQEIDSKKLKRILNIWSNGHGVVSMNIFHNITPSEAYTREAAIIDAIGMNNLTNQVRGHYHGVTESWNFKQRKQLGVGLLYKAFQIHLIEGESQLLPTDI